MKLKRKAKQQAYKPISQSQSDIDQGLKAAFSGAKQQPQQQQPRGMFAPKQQQPQQQQPQQQQGQFNIPNYWGAKPLTPKQPITQPQIQQQPQQPQPQEEEAYWSAEDWEEWAIALYNQFPDYRAILPDWFIEAMQEQ